MKKHIAIFSVWLGCAVSSVFAQGFTTEHMKMMSHLQTMKENYDRSLNELLGKAYLSKHWELAKASEAKKSAIIDLKEAINDAPIGNDVKETGRKLVDTYLRTFARLAKLEGYPTNKIAELEIHRDELKKLTLVIQKLGAGKELIEVGRLEKLLIDGKKVIAEYEAYVKVKQAFKDAKAGYIDGVKKHDKVEELYEKIGLEKLKMLEELQNKQNAKAGYHLEKIAEIKFQVLAEAWKLENDDSLQKLYSKVREIELSLSKKKIQLIRGFDLESPFKLIGDRLDVAEIHEKIDGTHREYLHLLLDF